MVHLPVLLYYFGVLSSLVLRIFIQYCSLELYVFTFLSVACFLISVIRYNVSIFCFWFLSFFITSCLSFSVLLVSGFSSFHIWMIHICLPYLLVIFHLSRSLHCVDLFLLYFHRCTSLRSPWCSGSTYVFLSLVSLFSCSDYYLSVLSLDILMYCVRFSVASSLFTTFHYYHPFINLVLSVILSFRI